MCASASYVGTQGRFRGSFAIRKSLICGAESLGSSSHFGACVDRWARALQPNPKRICDRRCSSGSSLGKLPRTCATQYSAHPRRRLVASRACLVGLPPGSRNLGGCLAECFVRADLSRESATMQCGRGLKPRCRSESSRRGGRGPNPARFSKSSVSWMRHVGGFDRDSVDLWLCS